jgi:hypothetical protein
MSHQAPRRCYRWAHPPSWTSLHGHVFLHPSWTGCCRLFFPGLYVCDCVCVWLHSSLESALFLSNILATLNSVPKRARD